MQGKVDVTFSVPEMQGKVESDYHGFLYDGQTYRTINPPSSVSTELKGVSGNTMVGAYSTSQKFGYVFPTVGEHGFVFDGTTYSNVDFPSAVATDPFAISGNTIVGQYGMGQNNLGFARIGGQFVTLDPFGSTQTGALGISGSQVVGFYKDSGGAIHGYETTLPEPALLMPVSSALLLLRRRRRL